MALDVRFESLADMLRRPRHVRFTPNSGHSPVALQCLRQQPTSRRSHSITFVRDLTRCEIEIGRLPVGGSNQAFGHQQEGREDQGVDNRDRDYASGKATVVVIKVCP
jgi:hypothetical protein